MIVLNGQVGLYEVNSSSVGNMTPVTPPFTIETLLTSDQYLTHYSSQETEPQQHISQTVSWLAGIVYKAHISKQQLYEKKEKMLFL